MNLKSIMVIYDGLIIEGVALCAEEGRYECKEAPFIAYDVYGIMNMEKK